MAYAAGSATIEKVARRRLIRAYSDHIPNIYVEREPSRGDLAHPLLRDDARFAVTVLVELAAFVGHVRGSLHVDKEGKP